MHDTFDFWGFYDECSGTVEKFVQTYLYSGRSCRDKHGSIYICILKPNRPFWNWFKGLGVHETCVFEAFLTNVLELSRKFMQKYIYSGRAWKDKHGSTYICCLKPSRTFGNWI